MNLKNTLLAAAICLLSSNPNLAVPATLLLAVSASFSPLDDDAPENFVPVWGVGRIVENRSGNKRRRR